MSLHLEAEKERLLTQIQKIRNSGSIAPAYYFIREITTTSKGKTYSYMCLLRQKRSVDAQKSKSLGRAGSEQHLAWVRAIARRDAIFELEQQLKMLDELMRRQQERSHLVERDFEEPDGDA